MILDQNITLGEIVLNYPNTVKVMNHFKIDYCCNGSDTLAVAIDKNEAAIVEVIEALNAAMIEQKQEEVTDWKSRTMTELIEYILDTHHEFVREVFDELNGLVFKVLKVHYQGHGEQLLKVHHLVGTLKTELEAHLIKEEENLFPLIKGYEATGDKSVLAAIHKFIQDTEDEHDAAGDLFKQLELVTNDFVPPLGACPSYQRVFYLIDALEKDTFNHIHLENSVLFTMLD